MRAPRNFTPNGISDGFRKNIPRFSGVHTLKSAFSDLGIDRLIQPADESNISEIIM